MEMPRTDDRYQMNPYRYGFCAIMDFTKPTVTAGTLGPAWNTLCRVDMARNVMERWWAGENAAVQEPQFVSRSADAPEADGWLFSVVTRLKDGVLTTELAVLDAARLSQGPLATVRLPLRLRGAIHGNWVSAETLAATRELAL
jgi:carotenoid cleavage dioxygenase